MEHCGTNGIVDDEQALLTIPEAARKLGIGRRQIDKAIAAGQIDVYSVGWPRVRWAQVRGWLEGRRRTTALEARS